MKRQREIERHYMSSHCTRDKLKSVTPQVWRSLVSNSQAECSVPCPRGPPLSIRAPALIYAVSLYVAHSSDFHPVSFHSIPVSIDPAITQSPSTPSSCSYCQPVRRHQGTHHPTTGTNIYHTSPEYSLSDFFADVEFRKSPCLSCTTV